MNKTELPKPSGFRLLIKSREIQEKTKGGIILTDDTKDIAKHACVVSQVVSMGDECYHDKETKWCKMGDLVLPVSYTHLTLPTNREV